MHLESDGSRFSGIELSKSQVFPWPPSLEILPGKWSVCVHACGAGGRGLHRISIKVYTQPGFLTASG